MFRRFIAALAALLLTVPAALAAEASYEISSYVLYMTVQADGSVRVREEIIYTNPSAYSGLTVNVSLAGAEGIDEIEAWTNGEPLEELPAERLGDAEGYTVSREGDRAVIEIIAPGDNDWRTFACAYTLRGLAKRYEDTALLERALVPAGREALWQSAAVIVTLPRSDGEVLAWADGPTDAIPLLIQYDTVSIGPLDVAADESLSAQILFPAEWLSEAKIIPRPMRESVVVHREALKVAAEREANARRAEQYTAAAAYVVLFGATLLFMAKKYGFKSRKTGAADETPLDRYAPALAGYALNEEATADMLAGLLAELVERGAVAAEKAEDGDVTLRLLARPENLSAHQRAALDWLFAGGGEASLISLDAAGNYERAQETERAWMDWARDVAEDMRREGLMWNNETALIVINLLCILCGVVLGFVLLLVGKQMVLEACGVALCMFFFTNQFNRVRHLTDEGERLRQAAASFSGMAERPQEELAARLPAVVALGGAARIDGAQGRLWQDAAGLIRSAHVKNASLRKKKK